MQLNINSRRDTLLVQFRQYCDLNQNNIDRFKTQLLGKISEGQLVILDFSRVEYVDSAGLTMLIYLRRRILDKKGKLRLIRVADRVKKLMQITRLHRILEVYPSIAEALRDGRPRGPAGDPHNSLHLHVKHTGTYSVVKMRAPDALIAANCRQFEIKIVEYLARSHRVILNFDEISSIDSAGIATLIRLKEGAKQTGDTILLVANTEVLSRLFKLYAIENLFPRFESNAAAVAALERKTGRSGQMQRQESAGTAVAVKLKPAAAATPASPAGKPAARPKTPRKRVAAAANPAPVSRPAAPRKQPMKPAAAADAGPAAATPAPLSDVQAVLADLQYDDILFLRDKRS